MQRLRSTAETRRIYGEGLNAISLRPNELTYFLFTVSPLGGVSDATYTWTPTGGVQQIK